MKVVFGIREKLEQFQGQADLRKVVAHIGGVNAVTLEFKAAAKGGYDKATEKILAASLMDDLNLVEFGLLDDCTRYLWSDKETEISLVGGMFADGSEAGRMTIESRRGDLGCGIAMTRYRGDLDGEAVDLYQIDYYVIGDRLLGKKSEWVDSGSTSKLSHDSDSSPAETAQFRSLLSRLMAEIGESYSSSFLARPLVSYVCAYLA